MAADGYSKKRSAEYSQKKYNQRQSQLKARRNRATYSQYSPYHQEGVSDDGTTLTHKRTPRRSRSTTSVGSARMAEARSGYNRKRAKKTAKKVSRARKSAIDFGNR